MRAGRYDRWSGRVRLRRNRRHHYTIEAWRDEVASWSDRLRRKARGGLTIEIELAEGRQLLEATALRARQAGAAADAAILRSARTRLARGEPTREPRPGLPASGRSWRPAPVTRTAAMPAATTAS